MEKGINNNSGDLRNENKKSIFKNIFLLLKFIFKSVFVVFELLKINKTIDLAFQSYTSGIKDIKKIPPEAHWFSKQKKINIIAGLVSVFIFFGGIFSSYYIISNNMFITKGFQKSYENIKQRKFSEAKNKLLLAQSLSPTFNQDIKMSFQVFGLSLLLAFLWGSNVLYKNPLLKNVELLKVSLKEQGLLKENQTLHMLFIPGLGVFLEISGGHTPRSILENNALWSSVGDGIKIGEFIEHPTIRKYVFFKVFYGLKKGDEYGYDQFKA